MVQRKEEKGREREDWMMRKVGSEKTGWDEMHRRKIIDRGEMLARSHHASQKRIQVQSTGTRTDPIWLDNGNRWRTDDLNGR